MFSGRQQAGLRTILQHTKQSLQTRSIPVVFQVLERVAVAPAPGSASVEALPTALALVRRLLAKGYSGAGKTPEHAESRLPNRRQSLAGRDQGGVIRAEHRVLQRGLAAMPPLAGVRVLRVRPGLGAVLAPDARLQPAGVLSLGVQPRPVAALSLNAPPQLAADALSL